MKLKNFKAVRDSKTIRLKPFTVFIGNNGSGKSSLIEGLQAYQTILTQGLDAAMNRWRGIEYIRNAGVVSNPGRKPEGRPYLTNPIEFHLRCNVKYGGEYPRDQYDDCQISMSITTDPSGDSLFIFEETFKTGNQGGLRRDKDGRSYNLKTKEARDSGIALPGSTSIINDLRYEFGVYRDFYDLVSRWQFLTLNPAAMGDPAQQRRSESDIQLENNGSNIAEYLEDIRSKDLDAFNSIIRTLQYILPFVSDVQPVIATELGRSIFLRLNERDFRVPGWLFSTGTLRAIALLAILRHPNPPPLILVEEIENGLDPRTINVIVDEIRDLTESGRSQVIATTHSPYLLDLLDLEQLIVVERVEGEPVFFRPADNQALREWAQTFTPGKLYTMSQLKRDR